MDQPPEHVIWGLKAIKSFRQANEDGKHAAGQSRSGDITFQAPSDDVSSGIKSSTSSSRGHSTHVRPAQDQPAHTDHFVYSTPSTPSESTPSERNAASPDPDKDIFLLNQKSKHSHQKHPNNAKSHLLGWRRDAPAVAASAVSEDQDKLPDVPDERSYIDAGSHNQRNVDADILYQVSKGAALHREDRCKPCLFVHTKVGCQHGAACEFCHLLHKHKKKSRPCKGKRDRYRKLINRMEQQAEQEASGAFASEDEEHHQFALLSL